MTADHTSIPAAAVAMRPRLDRVGWLLILALSLLWGCSFLFIKLAVPEIPPLTLVAARVMLAAASLHLVLRALGGRLAFDRNSLKGYATLGLFGNALPFSLLFTGMTVLPAGLGAILNATTPLFTLVIAALLTRDEGLSVGRIAGVAVGFAGVGLLVAPDLLRANGAAAPGAWPVWAQLLCLAAACSYGFAAVQGRRLKGGLPLANAAGTLTASSLLMLPVALLHDQPWTLAVPSSMASAALVALALASTALPLILFFRLLARAGPTNASLPTFLIPVVALLLGWSLLSERLGGDDLAAMAVIGLGLALIDGRPLAVLRAWVRAPRA